MHKQLRSFPHKVKRKSDEHVLSCEESAEFRELLRSLVDHYAPADHAELWLVQQLAHTQWRIGRAQACETGAYALLLERTQKHFDAEKVPEEQRLLKVWNPAQIRTKLTSAYEARLWRIAKQIRADLDRLITARAESGPPRRPAVSKRPRAAA